MKYTETGTSGSVVTIDETFLKAVSVVCGEVDKKCRESMARRYGVPLKKVNSPKLLELMKSSENVQEQLCAMEIGYVTTNYQVSFDNGRRVETGDFSDFLISLTRFSATPESMTISAGHYSRIALSIDIAQWSFRPPVKYKVDGDESDVSHITKLLQDAIDNTDSPSPWLHQAWPWAVLTTCITIFWFLCYLIVATRVGDASPDLSGFLAVIALPLLIPIFWASASISSLLRMNFPKLQFSWGVGSKRKAARRVAINWLIVGVLIPLACVTLSLVLA